MLKKLNLICVALFVLMIIGLTFTAREKQTCSPDSSQKTTEAKSSQSPKVVQKSDNSTDAEVQELNKMYPVFQAKASPLSVEANEKGIPTKTASEEEKSISENNSQPIVKSKADEIIDSLFPELKDTDEVDVALKKSLKYSFPQVYLNEFLNEKQLSKVQDIWNGVVADFDILSGTTPITDKESEQKVYKRIREINEQYFIDCINILTKEEQLEFVKILNEKWIPPLREGTKKYGIDCLRQPWF